MDFKKLDELLDRLVAWRMPGNACIVIKDGKIVHRYASGFADIEAGKKMTGDETYNMWSCSKPITCAAALTLYEKGLFLLDDPIERYIPEFANPMVKSKDEDGKDILVPAKNKIKVRDLFSMSSGYNYDINQAAIKAIREKTGGRCPTADVIREIAKWPLVDEPGTAWNYGLSHDILAYLVEVVSGMRFNDYVKKAIFEPLGMEDSTYSNPTADLIERMARQYTYDADKDRLIPSDNSVSFVFGSHYDSGGAGLISTVLDYGKFAYAMANGGVGLNGGRILSAGTIDLMRSNMMKGKIMKYFDWMHLYGYSYGLGVRTMVDLADAGSNGSVGEFGWAGAAGAHVLIDPDRNLAAFYCQHMLNSAEEFFAPRFRNVVYSCID